jgi:hypothetical protein
MIKKCYFVCALAGLIAAAPLSPDPQATAAKAVVTAAIMKINANDAVGLRSLFTDNATIIDEVPPFRWSGPDAVAKWLSQSNAFAGTDGLKTFTQSSSDLLGFEKGRAHFDAAFRVNLSKKGRVSCGKWVFVLQRIGESWKIREAIWTSLPDGDPDC